jgi:DNA-binding NarL/FixJ family response regulator
MVIKSTETRRSLPSAGTRLDQAEGRSVRYARWHVTIRLSVAAGIPRLGQGSADRAQFRLPSDAKKLPLAQRIWVCFGHFDKRIRFAVEEDRLTPFVLIVEDHPLVVDSLVACVRDCDAGLEVIAAESVQAALSILARRPAPLLILTDLTLPDARGTESVRQLRQAAAQTPVLVVTALDEPQLRSEAQQLEVVGYLIKNTAVQVLRDEIRAVVGRSIAAAPRDAASLKVSKLNSLLSPKQLAVLRELASGRSNKEVAKRMNIGEETVHSHVKEIFGRLGVKNRTEAVVRFLELGHDQ